MRADDVARTPTRCGCVTFLTAPRGAPTIARRRLDSENVNESGMFMTQESFA